MERWEKEKCYNIRREELRDRTDYNFIFRCYQYFVTFRFNISPFLN